MNNVINMPNTKPVTFGGLNLQLRLDGRSILSIEKRLDKSLMGLFIGGNGGFKLPPTNELLIVIQGANKTSGVTDERIVEAFEKHLDEGKSVLEIQEIVQELLEDSGFFGKKKEVTPTDGESVDEVNLESTPLEQEESSLL
ncbi:DUF6096 family protein [Vagococcus hydrophili]|uniref:Uncharacterized protein n=1 Tax=Vagococcus hydrophili TaxID=2714947 RepID=A0A6G8AQ32_9ENTE|nr:DUF6096 family protein [Vagococcus hydrophili]QIL47033.1 hypothetical protein G7082_00050 [Vagococcus hydrophili]